MKIFETIALAFSAFFDHPLRSFLTSIGIIIGVATVYAMLAIGEGTKREVEKSLNSISTRTMHVWRDWSARRQSQGRPILPFTEDDIQELRQIEGVYAATGYLMSQRLTVSTPYGDASCNFQGIDEDYLKAGDQKISLGANFSYADLEQKRPVAIISEDLKKRLFKNQNPIGEEIKVARVAFTIKGVTKKADSALSFGNDSMFVLVPLTVARERVIGGNRFVRRHVTNVKVVGETDADFKQIEKDITEVLRRSRNIRTDAPSDFRVFTSRGWREKMAKSSKTIGMFLATIGAISLVVGGVGVMNIMLVSVSERTREIGLRMALGAKKANILWQFLTEALFLCVFSGIIGLGLGYGLSKIVTSSQKIELDFSLPVALIAFGSALVTGLVFGALPAIRAAKLNPIEALRHE